MYDQNQDEDSIFHDRIDINAFGMAGRGVKNATTLLNLSRLFH
jgi:hypothetical protein